MNVMHKLQFPLHCIIFSTHFSPFTPFLSLPNCMDSAISFNFQPNAYPFDYNWNQFVSMDDIFGPPQLENVLLDGLEVWGKPCNNSSELKDVKIDDDFFNCDFGSFYQVSPMIDEKTPSFSSAVVTNPDAVVKMEMESPVLVENHNHHSSCSRTVIRGRKRSVPLQLEEIRKYFDLPITNAAKEMRVGLTVLKKRCRELNIMRWPHRKIKSLEALINNVKEMGLDEEIVVLEKHKRLIEKLPDVELTDRTRKLRQACFKANYKKRRLLAEHS